MATWSRHLEGEGRMARRQVEIRTDDGVCPASVFRASAGAGPWPGVIVYMDGAGIRPVLFAMAQRLADEGFLVLLPDLFYRAGPYEPVDAKTLFSVPEKRAAHARYFKSVDNTKAAADTQAFLQFLDGQSDLASEKLGVVGYCTGGGMALTAAARYPERFAAAATFHGAALATDAPDSPHELAGRIKAQVLVAGADQDPSFPPEQAARLAAAFEDAGVDHRVEIWQGAAHGWTMKDFPVYNEAAAERHFQELVALFRRTLRPTER
jgi:carboxymethylenebutenolidase